MTKAKPKPKVTQGAKAPAKPGGVVRYFQRGSGWHYSWGQSTCGAFRSRELAEKDWARRLKHALD